MFLSMQSSLIKLTLVIQQVLLLRQEVLAEFC